MSRIAFSLVLGVAGLSLSLSPSAASAATFQVDTSIDSPLSSSAPPCVCQAARRGGGCSLRAAIQAANACPGHDVIDILPVGPFTLVVSGTYEDAGATGDLDVTEAVTILGHGQWVRAAFPDRVLDVHPPAGDDVTVSELRLSNGAIWGSASEARGGGIRSVGAVLTLDSVTIDGCHADNLGGGLSVEEGELTAIGGSIEGNTAGNDGAGAHVSYTASATIDGTRFEANEAGGFGGGLVALRPGVAVVNDAVFEGNSAQRGGGGTLAVTSMGESVTFHGCDFERNAATIAGGGLLTQVDADAAEVSVEESVFDRNRALIGGGMVGPGTVGRSTFVGNYASQTGGAISLREELGLTVNAPIVVENATFYRNHAGWAGGAMFVRDAFADVTHATFEVNSAPSQASTIYALAAVHLRSSIVSYPGGAPATPHCNGAVSVGHNVANDLSCLSLGTDIVTSSVGLGSYANHGGPTPTVSLGAGSPAIDHGDPGACPAIDQRGQPRPAGACDAGAYERQPGR